ncbi:unnamed protein product, partial [Ectocarpus sp. 12 AP-2014]
PSLSRRPVIKPALVLEKWPRIHPPAGRRLRLRAGRAAGVPLLRLLGLAWPPPRRKSPRTEGAATRGDLRRRMGNDRRCYSVRRQSTRRRRATCEVPG